MDWLTVTGSWVRLLVEIGIFAGVTWLVYMSKYHYNQSLRAKDDQIKSKDAQIALLEITQIENVWSKFEAMKKYIRDLDEQLEKRINESEAAQKDKDKLIAELKVIMKNIESTLATSGFYNAIVRALSETKDKE